MDIKEYEFIELLNKLELINPGAADYLRGAGQKVNDFHMCGDLNDMFSWSNTDQGHTFWANLHKEVLDLRYAAKIKKVSISDEIKNMSLAVNGENLKAFKEILPFFYYDEDTNKRIIDQLDPNKIDAHQQDTDNRYGLSRDLRVTYELEQTQEIDIDEGFTG